MPNRLRIALILAVASVSAHAQDSKPAASPFAALKFRQIGPFRGGRVGAVTGVQSDPQTFYFGATGGGIFKTTDGGMHWTPIADGQIKLGSVGAIAVADSDPNILYVGMGEGDIRGNASHGDGVYKSSDAGKTWVHVGLTDTQQISPNLPGCTPGTDAGCTLPSTTTQVPATVIAVKPRTTT